MFCRWPPVALPNSRRFWPALGTVSKKISMPLPLVSRLPATNRNSVRPAVGLPAMVLFTT